MLLPFGWHSNSNILLLNSMSGTFSKHLMFLFSLCYVKQKAFTIKIMVVMTMYGVLVEGNIFSTEH